jgi:hypothetical protein
MVIYLSILSHILLRSLRTENISSCGFHSLIAKGPQVQWHVFSAVCVSGHCWYCGIFSQNNNCVARETAIASEQLWHNILANDCKQTSSGGNSGSTVGNEVFYGGSCQGVVRKTTETRIGNWKRVAIQRGLEHGSGEIVIIEAITRQLLVKTLQAGKDLAYVVVICKEWKLVMML